MPINFPIDPSAQTPANEFSPSSYPAKTDNNTIYKWEDPKWVAYIPSLEDGVYVEVTGDNMTGNLTLGTDKITLNAGDGQIQAGYITCDGSLQNGPVTVRRDNPLGSVFTGELAEIGEANEVTSVIYASGDASFNGDITGSGSANFAGDIQSTSQNGGQLAGFRNQLINGNFNVWQRGTTFTLPNGPLDSGKYSADRWYVANGGSGTPSTVSRTATTPLGFGLAITTDANCGGLNQGIEIPLSSSGNALDNQFKLNSTWTLSVYANKDLTNSSGRLRWSSTSTGSGATDAAATTQFTLVPNTTSNGFNLYQATFTITASSSGTVKCLVVSLPCALSSEAGSELSAGVNYTGVQLEPGPVATPFEHRPIGTELALCQRYYQQTPNRLGGASSQMDGSAGIVYSYPSTMRVTPTITSPSTSGFAVSNSNSSSSWLKTSSIYIEQIFLDAEL